MARKKTGTIVKTKSGLWQAVISLKDGSRKRLKPFAKGTSEAMAREKAAAYAERAMTMGLERPAPKDETPPGSAWWETYFAYRDAKGFCAVRPIYNKHIAPLFAAKKPADWTREDCQRLVRELDAKVVAGLSWRTAWNVWTLFTKACKVTASHKSPDGLRVRAENPCLGVEGPDRGESKEKHWLYPDEMVRLLACPLVPVRERRLYALLAYLYVRPGELRALEWRDVNLTMGTVHVSKAWDSGRDQVKAPKTGAGVRFVPIELALRPLLEVMRAESGGAGLVMASMPHGDDLAANFRRDLLLAGVTRAELHAGTATNKRIRIYDLRATGITWRCLRKDYGPEIQQAAGHEQYATTDIYIRSARVFIGRTGEPFPALPAESLHRNDRPKAKPSESLTDSRVSNPTQRADISITPGNTDGRFRFGVRVHGAKYANAGGAYDSSDHMKRWRADPVVTFRVPVRKVGRIGLAVSP